VYHVLSFFQNSSCRPHFYFRYASPWRRLRTRGVLTASEPVSYRLVLLILTSIAVQMLIKKFDIYCILFIFVFKFLDEKSRSFCLFLVDSWLTFSISFWLETKRVFCFLFFLLNLITSWHDDAGMPARQLCRMCSILL